MLATTNVQNNNLLGLVLPFAIMMGFFYIFVIRPENKRRKKYKSMLDSVKVNDEIITKGGILGKVINIQDTYIILETGPSRVRIKLDKNGILSLINSSETVEEKKEDES
ncbi:preprotein translocase subunit YajC [Clostridium malenominatum]|uniref:Preprotein translocase subunit YajC n=1 Tax=Clostridium malenominatum TaxID=1539 RepID=A0ABP3UDF5_9CLOT